MENVKMEVKGNMLTIQVDLSQRLGPSTSGKTTIIGTTGGNAKVPGHDKISFGLNVFTK